jgi:hypothetical protein
MSRSGLIFVHSKTSPDLDIGRGDIPDFVAKNDETRTPILGRRKTSPDLDMSRSGLVFVHSKTSPDLDIGPGDIPDLF